MAFRRFLPAYIKSVALCAGNHYATNYDSHRFGPRAFRQRIGDLTSPFRACIGYIASARSRYGLRAGLEFVEPHLEEIEWLYRNLTDQKSRDVLVQILAYRALGRRKVKLPLNNPQYWSALQQAERQMKNKEMMELGFKGWPAHKVDLSNMGYPIKVFTRPSALVSQFVLQQYRCQSDSICIGAAEGDYVIDAGACYGDTALYFACNTGANGRVFAFEFAPQNLGIFRRNIALNPDVADRIAVFERALWSATGEDLAVDLNGPATRIVPQDSKDQTLHVTSLTIDDFASVERIPKIDFIKMDLEGAELAALEGAEKTLRACRPKLAITVYHSLEDFWRIPQYLDQLDLGYRFYLRHFSIHEEETVLFAIASAAGRNGTAPPISEGSADDLRHLSINGVAAAGDHPVTDIIQGAAAKTSSGTGSKPLYVGGPNIGDTAKLHERLNQILDRRWLTNNGPMVREFEHRVAEYVGVKHCILTCNATLALEIASRALDLRGEVIMPAYTFVATAHAFQWQQITPVFADIDPTTYTVDCDSIERLITSKTSAIVPVHLWGRACDIERIERLARKHSLRVVYDAAHAFGCSYGGKMIGNFGDCEVFSFHATKFVNSFEGGAIVTNNDLIAEKARLMRNFGFSGVDCVIYPGVNAKMTEICAAMGLTSLEAMEEIVATNRRNYDAYARELSDIRGIELLSYDRAEKNNYHYIVLEIEPAVFPYNRDELVEMLHSHNIIARKYFWPGCHRMEPYRSLQPDRLLALPVTDRIAERILLLPTGQAVTTADIQRIGDVIRRASRASGGRGRRE